MRAEKKFMLSQEPKKPKRMLSCKQVGQKCYVEINSSSLDILQTCMRKSYYTLHERLVSTGGDNTALAFGTAIHKALEHWMSLPTEARNPSASDKQKAQLICAGSHVDFDV